LPQVGRGDRDGEQQGRLDDADLTGPAAFDVAGRVVLQEPEPALDAGAAVLGGRCFSSRSGVGLFGVGGRA
jgi:hypothetical protein